MSVGSALLAQLRALTAGVDGDDSLEEALSSLVIQLRATVSSYCALQLVVMSDGHPVTLTDVVPGSESPAASLGVPLDVVVPELRTARRVVFFAVTPGALVDLAADLSHALNLPLITGRSPAADGSPTRWDGERAIRLDGDLPADSLTCGLVGVEELSTINRAVGMLIGQGHPPKSAHRTLRRRALAAGLELHVFAAQLLGRG